jgi:hypothetical protein
VFRHDDLCAEFSDLQSAVAPPQVSPVVASISNAVIRRGDLRPEIARLHDQEEEKRLQIEEMHMRMEFDHRASRARGCGGCAGGRRKQPSTRVYGHEFAVGDSEYRPVDPANLPQRPTYGTHALPAIERK